MKLLIRDFVANLRERKELDAIVPDILSALGLTVLTRPSIGPRQYGVDLAAVGQLDDDPPTLYLFTLKQGDLDRAHWDNGPQSVRASLNEILDVYIRSNIPAEFANFPLKIVLCFGGELREAVLQNWSGYVAEHTSDKLSFTTWNGEKIANLILVGVLGPELLPEEAKRSFQKAVALTDEPDVSFHHFCRVVDRLRQVALDDPRRGPQIVRTLSIALWVLYVWARENDNIEAAYLSSERSLLTLWDLLKGSGSDEGQPDPTTGLAFGQVINLNNAIFADFFERKVAAHVAVKNALAMAIRSYSPVDVNLAMFSLVGRLALMIIWKAWALNRAEMDEASEEDLVAGRREVYGLAEQLKSIVLNNQVLFLPVCDEQVTDMGLVLVALISAGDHSQFIRSWLSEMTKRLWFTAARRYRFPTSHHEYRRILGNQTEKNSEETFKVATKGSSIIPVVAAWIAAFDDIEAASRLSEIARERLSHCTMQAWLIGPDSEEHLYLNTGNHGVSLTDLPITGDGRELLQILQRAAVDTLSDLDGLTAVKWGFWPIVLQACRHWRLPVPIQFWIDSSGKPEPSPTEKG